VVDVTGEDAPERRVEVIRRRLAFEDDPAAFAATFAAGQQALAEQIENAKAILKEVTYSDDVLAVAAEIAIRLGVDGHRADITMVKTALTQAALDGRKQVTREDMLAAAALTLPHRLRRQPFEEGTVDLESVAEIIRKGNL
jgi:magnesium chelatase subunit I